MSKNRNVLYEERERIIDHTTGVLKEERHHTLVRKTTPEFIMLFQQTSEPLRNANLTTAQSSLLFEILTGGYILRDNRVDLTPGARDEMEKNTKLSRNTINKAISVFVERDLILREPTRRTGHLLNPYIFGKGRFTDLEKLRLEVSTEFDFEKLESTRYEKTTGVYKQSRELLETPHKVVSDETLVKENTQHREVEVEECEVMTDLQQTNQRELLEFNRGSQNRDSLSMNDYNLEMLREENKAKELNNRAAELRIDEMKMQVELLKLQREQ